MIFETLTVTHGWINRALPASELGSFVSSLAHRIARFPAAGRAVVKERVNAIGLPPVEDIRRDSETKGNPSERIAPKLVEQKRKRRGMWQTALERPMLR